MDHKVNDVSSSPGMMVTLDELREVFDLCAPNEDDQVYLRTLQNLFVQHSDQDQVRSPLTFMDSPTPTILMGVVMIGWHYQFWFGNFFYKQGKIFKQGIVEFF